MITIKEIQRLHKEVDKLMTEENLFMTYLVNGKCKYPWISLN